MVSLSACQSSGCLCGVRINSGKNLHSLYDKNIYVYIQIFNPQNFVLSNI